VVAIAFWIRILAVLSCALCSGHCVQEKEEEKENKDEAVHDVHRPVSEARVVESTQTTLS
jgi:hypothetical protein